MSISANYPNVRPSLLLDFANSQQLDPRVTFSRSTTAPYYDGKTSVLAEQNLQIYSQAYNTAGWAQGVGGLAQSTTLTTAPDGTTTGTAIYPTTAGTNSGARLYTLSGSSAVAIYTFSFYAKPNGLNFVFLNQPGNAGAGVAWFNLGTGALGTINAAWTATITSAGNGWYRCTATPNSSIAQGSSLSIAPCDSDNSILATTSGTNGIQLWGVQIEQRSSVTAYNATTTSALTNYIPQLLTAPINSPRFDFNPTTGESLGLLIEQSSTNLLTYSQDFSNGWGLNGSPTLTINAAIAPDGTQTANQVVTTGSSQGYYKYTTTSIGTSYTGSEYFKLASGAGVFNNINIGLSVPNGSMNVNLSTGVASSIGSAITSQSVTSVGNGWWRISISAVATSVSTGWNFISGQAETLLVWGAQLEALAFPTSYISTTSAQVTRASDNASMTGTNFSSWYNNAQGTFYTEFDILTISSLSTRELIGFNGSGNSRFFNGIAWGGASYTACTWGMYAADFVGSSLNLSTGFQKIASSYANGSVTGVANGGTIYTKLGEIPTPTAVYFGADFSATRILNGHFKKIAFYSIAFTGSQQQALTGS
jgi:hypothetical protein